MAGQYRSGESSSRPDRRTCPLWHHRLQQPDPRRGHELGNTLHAERLSAHGSWRLYGGIRDPLRRRRSEEHTSELQSLMRISYAVLCLKNNKLQYTTANNYRVDTQAQT